MARGKGGKGGAGASAAAAAQAMGEAFGRALRPLLPLLFLGLLYAGAAYLFWLPLRRDPRTCLSRDEVGRSLREVVRRHPWFSQQDIQRLEERAQAIVGRSVFEPRLAGELASAFAESPWIRRTGDIRLYYPAMIRVRAEDFVFRQPYAVLRTRHGRMVVDGEGAVLPVPANAVPGQLPIIDELYTESQTPGTVLKELKVQEGLALVAAVSRVCGGIAAAPHLLRAYMVGAIWKLDFETKVAERPLTVEWGCWEDEFRPVGERPRAQKLVELGKHFQELDVSRFKVVRLSFERTTYETW